MFDWRQGISLVSLAHHPVQEPPLRKSEHSGKTIQLQVEYREVCGGKRFRHSETNFL